MAGLKTDLEGQAKAHCPLVWLVHPGSFWVDHLESTALFGGGCGAVLGASDGLRCRGLQTYEGAHDPFTASPTCRLSHALRPA